MNAQKTLLFYDDFGSPEEAQVRRIWKYMPTGAYNTFIFAHPGAPNIGGKPYSEAKAIENNFYAVVAPRAIYSSVGVPNDQDWAAGDNMYRIWPQLVAKGDVTPGHNGDGGALVINAGTTLSSLYVRFANLQTGKYYKLSYKIFIQNATVKLKHQILNSSGNSTLAESEKEWSSGTDPDWYSVETWFHVPDDCPGGEYSVALTNAHSNDSGNDFAIDELKFEEYESGPDGSTEIKDVKCEIIEPIAGDDIKNLSCDDIGKPVVLEVLANDFYDSKPIDFNKFNFTFMVPIGWKYFEWDGLTAPNEGKWTLNKYVNPITVTFTPNADFTGNPTPIYYKLVSRDGSTGNSGVAQLIITYDCNPVTNNDTEKMTVDTPVTIYILKNDKLSDGVTTPQASDVTVTLKNPFNAVDTGTTITVEGEGTWTYSESDGELTFTPDAGFTGVPTPITYTFKEKTSEKTSTAATVTITVDETPPSKNYWHGTIDTDWAEKDNWTANYVPASGEDIEFATVENYGEAAKDHLHLDTDRVIGDLINESETEKNLVVTIENQLIINGKVGDDNTGIIVVEADEEKAIGTLIFKDPDNNQNVAAKVEFINLADECADCGFYKRNWQYFGIPVDGGAFPFNNPLLDGEMVRRWDEPTNGDKWLDITAASPVEEMTPFMGYEITSKETAPKYEFEGTLNVGDKNIILSKTSGVNYSGMNLLSNSYTAAIPIELAAIELGSSLAENTVYLFNRGTRDQWRKTNGGSVPGTAGGQYTAVPVELAGQATLPDRILSMHSFMVNAASDGTQITLKYDQLVKNEAGAGQPAWRSADNNGKRQLPYIVLDVIGEGSADRVWLFEESSTTRGYDNGWDGHKMLEGDLIQVFATDADQNKYQVTTVPQFDDITVGIAARENESYTISVSTAADVENRRLYLHDTFTGRGYLLKDGAEIIIPGTRSANQNRFKITASNLPAAMTEASTINTYVRDNVIVVENRSGENAIVSVYDISGRFVGKAQIAKDEMKSFPELSIAAGVKVVKVVSDSGAVNCSDRVLLK